MQYLVTLGPFRKFKAFDRVLHVESNESFGPRCDELLVTQLVPRLSGPCVIVQLLPRGHEYLALFG